MPKKIVVVIAVLVGLCQAANFTNADFSGTWSLYGYWYWVGVDNLNSDDCLYYGTIISDGNGNIIGGTVTNSYGETHSIPLATYTVNSDGTLNIDFGEGAIFHGAMNGSKDVICFVMTIPQSDPGGWEYNVGVAFKRGFSKGDINLDGEIDISDVILCLRMAVGLPVVIGGHTYNSPYPDWLIEVANVNEDGVVDISDVIKILRKALGLDF